jgi:hypothetical protein
MNRRKRSWYLLLLAVAGLLVVVACQPGAAPAGTLQSTEAPTQMGDLAATSTIPVPTEPPPTLMATPTMPPPTDPPPAAVSTATAPPPATTQANADVLHVRAVQTAGPATGSDQAGAWTFHVTVQHPDTGWEDYADGWDVLIPDGTVLKPDSSSPFTRLLLHPHVGEQPFTRSQSGIVIPSGVTQVRVRAHDLVDGYGGREVLVDLTVASGEDFQVERQP